MWNRDSKEISKEMRIEISNRIRKQVLLTIRQKFNTYVKYNQKEKEFSSMPRNYWAFWNYTCLCK